MNQLQIQERSSTRADWWRSLGRGWGGAAQRLSRLRRGWSHCLSIGPRRTRPRGRGGAAAWPRAELTEKSWLQACAQSGWEPCLAAGQVGVRGDAGTDWVYFDAVSLHTDGDDIEDWKFKLMAYKGRHNFQWLVRDCYRFQWHRRNFLFILRMLLLTTTKCSCRATWCQWSRSKENNEALICQITDGEWITDVADF